MDYSNFKFFVWFFLNFNTLFFLTWQKIQLWNHSEGLQIEDVRTDYLSGFSNSSFREKPSMNFESGYKSYDLGPSQSFEYFYDESRKKYCCNICSFESIYKHCVVRHLLTHSGAKPFKCHICSYSCSEKGNLKVHLRTHTGEKPFVCKICSSAFTQKHHLNYHLSTHRNANISSQIIQPYKGKTTNMSEKKATY